MGYTLETASVDGCAISPCYISTRGVYGVRKNAYVTEDEKEHVVYVVHTTLTFASSPGAPILMQRNLALDVDEVSNAWAIIYSHMEATWPGGTHDP